MFYICLNVKLITASIVSYLYLKIDNYLSVIKIELKMQNNFIPDSAKALKIANYYNNVLPKASL